MVPRMRTQPDAPPSPDRRALRTPSIMPRLTTAASIRKRLRELGDPTDAAFLQGFFKTGPGQYGEGDRFLGIRVPDIRRLARELRGLPLDQIELLLHDDWHET